jgi:hypothetical protein
MIALSNEENRMRTLRVIRWVFFGILIVVAILAFCFAGVTAMAVGIWGFGNPDAGKVADDLLPICWWSFGVMGASVLLALCVKPRHEDGY